MAGAHRHAVAGYAAVCSLPLSHYKVRIVLYFTTMKKAYLFYYIAAALFVLAAVYSFVQNAVQRGSVALVLALGMALAGYRFQKRGNILD